MQGVSQDSSIELNDAGSELDDERRDQSIREITDQSSDMIDVDLDIVSEDLGLIDYSNTLDSMISQDMLAVDRDLASEDAFIVDECLDNHGGCGNPEFFRCYDEPNNPPTCEDIDECLFENGGCGDIEYFTCTNRVGTEPTCEDIDECLVENGGCGDVEFFTCTNRVGTEPTCTPLPQLALDYASYQRRVGERFTPLPQAIPLPHEACTSLNQIIWEGEREECMVHTNTCVIIPTGAQVSCSQGVMVHGTLWVQSDEAEQLTLLLADSIMVMEEGNLIISGSSSEQASAQNVEVFLRHEYCGLPGDDFSHSSPNEAECLSKGRLTSHGIMKIIGQAKTPWSLLTQDSLISHVESDASIKVDDCSGWQIGDTLVVSATGGDATMFAGAQGATLMTSCDEVDCQASFNFKAEKRTITAIEYTNNDTLGCSISLDQALRVNHRGNPVAEGSILRRIQAEVSNQSRSVVITGGAHFVGDPVETRIRTRYDYSRNGHWSADYPSNEDASPCRKCVSSDDPSFVNTSPNWICSEPEMCTAYSEEPFTSVAHFNSTDHYCGLDCSTMGMQGITTSQRHGGVMQISHTAIDGCGRRELAEYCLHFHHVGDVKALVDNGTNDYESYLVGNSIQNGINKGITIHGTHRALIQQNVVFDQRGPGIYIEDGNELFNVVEENVVICSEAQPSGPTGRMVPNSRCRFKNSTTRQETTDSDFSEVSGIYFLSPTNHTIGNRVSGYDNAMYVHSNTSGSRGLGLAQGQVCIPNAPFGETVGNVFHNNGGFGWYANMAFPMDMIELGGLNMGGGEDQGKVTDWTKCLPFALDGSDQAQNVIVRDHFEYFNDFSAGVYDMGDVSFIDSTFYATLKGLYWKTYRRGPNSGPLCERCTFINNGAELPGGSGLVEFDDSQFYLQALDNGIEINHHCNESPSTGGLCASHYDFRNTTFYLWNNQSGTYDIGQYPNHVFHNGRSANEADPNDRRTAALIYTPDDKVLVNEDRIAVFDIENNPHCTTETLWIRDTEEDPWSECTESQLALRGVRIWSADRGILTVTNHTEGNQSYEIPWERHKAEPGHAQGIYGGVIPNCQDTDCLSTIYTAGYMFVVPDGHELSLSFEQELEPEDLLSDLLTLEYSEEQLEPQTSINIRRISGSGLTELEQGDLNCIISSQHPRKFITPYGALNAASGALYTECSSAWTVKRPIEDLMDHVLNSESNTDPNTDTDPDPNPNPDPDPDPEMSEPSTYPPQLEPTVDASNVIGLYGSTYPDAFPNDISWLPFWNHPATSGQVDYVLSDVEGGPPQDRMIRVVQEPAFDWFGLFEFPNGMPTPLDLVGYDTFAFDIWTPNITHLTVRFRDYGANQLWDAGEAGVNTDGERAQWIGAEQGLTPNEWSSIEVDLNQLFVTGDARQVGQLVILVNDRSPIYQNNYFYLANLRFIRN